MTETYDAPRSELLSQVIVEGMKEKKARDITVMDLRNIQNAVADFFVICTGNSDTQVDAISESVEKVVNTKTYEYPWQREGRQNKEWVLLDYVNVVAHIFKQESREFYGLEYLWGDAETINIAEAS